MANTLLTPSVIAREALATLYAQTVMLPLVHRDYSADFAQVGDTITVRKPATFTAQEFTGSAVTVQDAVETSVAVQMNKHYDVSFAVTAKDLTLSISDFSAQLLAPAMAAIAQKVDSLLLGLYADVYWATGTAGTTPSTIANITDARERLQRSLVPVTERRLVLDPAADNKLLQVLTFIEADKVGDSGTALREASLGRKYGFDIFSGQNVVSHDNGTIAHSGTFAVNGAVAAGATSMSLDGTTVTGTWKKGSVFTVAGSTQQYVVTADATAAANAVTISFLPAAPTGGIADNTVVTRVANHVANLAFHRNAFAFVSRPLAMPMGVGQGQAATVNFDGLGLRVVYTYDSSLKRDQVSVDLLCGAKTLDAQRATRVMG